MHVWLLIDLTDQVTNDLTVAPKWQLNARRVKAWFPASCYGPSLEVGLGFDSGVCDKYDGLGIGQSFYYRKMSKRPVRINPQ